MARSNRREFCRTMLGGAAGLSLAWTSPAAFAQTTSMISVTKVTDTLSLITGAGSNVVLFNAPEGALNTPGILSVSIPPRIGRPGDAPRETLRTGKRTMIGNKFSFDNIRIGCTVATPGIFLFQVARGIATA